MKRASGFTIIELVVIVGIIGILAIISIPSYHKIRIRAYNASAISAGKQFETAQGVYESQNARYAVDMDQVLSIDKNLLDAGAVTFLWIAAAESGYTINVTHKSGDEWYTYSDDKLSN